MPTISKEEISKIYNTQIGRAHVWTPVTIRSRMPSSAWKKKKKNKKKKKKKKTKKKKREKRKKKKKMYNTFMYE